MNRQLVLCIIGIELCEDMLEMNPKSRIDVERAIANKYFLSYHDPDDERVPENAFDDSFEKLASIPEIKASIFNFLRETMN